MSATLEDLVEECVALKKGDKEFVLFRFAEDRWAAGIGNPCSSVTLGESEPEFSAEGATALRATRALRALLFKTDGLVPRPLSPAEARFDAMIDDLTDDELRHWNAAQVEAYPDETAHVKILRASWVTTGTIDASKLNVLSIDVKDIKTSSRRITADDI